MTEPRHIKISRLNNKGLTLATSIILLVFASTAVLSVTTFIIQRLLQAEAKHAGTKAIYLAQAGINNAMYSYRSANGYFSLGQTNVDANNYFVLGATPAELLMVNTATAALTSSSTRLSNVTIRNAADSPITISSMVVSWPANGRKLKEIWIDGRRLFRSGGGVAPPANANLSPDFALPASSAATYSIDYLLFNGSMAGVAYIDVQFVMTDGSNKTVRLYQDGVTLNNFNFTVKALGNTTGSTVPRTIRADYNALTNKIFNYYEIAN